MREVSQALERRIGSEVMRQRLRLEAGVHDSEVVFGFVKIKLKHLRGLYDVVGKILKWLGLWEIGRRHSLEYIVQHETPVLDRLPPAFRHFRILHISDLHIEAMVDQGERLGHIVNDLKFDLCVITGDYRYTYYGTHEEAIKALSRLVQNIRCPEGILGVLGNHDSLDMVADLERIGIRILLNESVVIERGGSRLRIAGVDDPHYFRTFDLAKAFRGSGPEEFRILLAHSPEIVYEAERAGADLYLCGHSHGGQICLPGGVMVFGNAQCPRKFFSRSWKHEGLTGYTSHGSGVSGVPLRFFSHPEVTIHELVGKGDE